jgi:phosphoribosyl 1,2-cyclic phosphodiesterase
MDKVKAVFISHEHTDHIRGLSTLANRYYLPIYITAGTSRQGPHLVRHLSRPFSAGEPVEIGNLQVVPFAKRHDAADPHSFLVRGGATTVGIFTDIGEVCSHTIHHFRQCHAAILESNYDEEMLDKGAYPLHLKNRIRGGLGHLSNRQAAELFREYRPPFMTHLLLGHLSKENNHPSTALAAFSPHHAGVHLQVASRYEATGVFTISAGTLPAANKQAYTQSTLFS